MYAQRDIDAYIRDVNRLGVLHSEVGRVQKRLLEETLHPSEQHKQAVVNLTQIFKALLAEKARQEVVQQIGQDDSGSPENGSTCPTGNTPRRISIRDILQQQIARG